MLKLFEQKAQSYLINYEFKNLLLIHFPLFTLIININNQVSLRRF